MSHDPLCPEYENQPAYLNGYMCCCEEIAAARADEREQAARRVEALCWHTKHEGSLPCAHDEAAAAVRGVQP